ncbi:MAG: ATP-binding protein, partial [Clostridiales bacterium]|nr:ATP-binding protein [Clostridiales bacterium]
KEYLKRLIEWKDEQVIKAVTGIRRCGKSTLLVQYQDYLRENNVTDEQIISINFEELENEGLLDYKALYSYIKEKLCKDKMTYIFLDEVQNVNSFEKVIDSIYVKKNTDIYITGSNSYLLSGELATLLTGRYVEISMLPLSFSEYKELSGETSDEAFSKYLKYGGMPYIASMNKTEEKVNTYIEGIYNTVVIKDIEDRQKRREANLDNRKINDITLLKTIAKYLSSVIGSQVSIKGVTDYLTSSGHRVSPNTVNNYMCALEESYIFYPADRFDIIGKEILKSNKKWYIVDLGIRNHILPRKNYDLGFSVENIVYLELLRRGYKVNVGKFANREVDFAAQKNGVLTYFQVTADMTNELTFEREMSPLKSIKDNYEKIVLTLDKFSSGNYEGIKVINLIDWLLS